MLMFKDDFENICQKHKIEFGIEPKIEYEKIGDRWVKTICYGYSNNYGYVYIKYTPEFCSLEIEAKKNRFDLDNFHQSLIRKSVDIGLNDFSIYQKDTSKLDIYRILGDYYNYRERNFGEIKKCKS